MVNLKTSWGAACVTLVCQALRMHKQTKTRCRDIHILHIIHIFITITDRYRKGSVERQKGVGETKGYLMG